MIRKQKIDGRCVGCKYIFTNKTKYPCKKCSRLMTDNFEAGEPIVTNDAGADQKSDQSGLLNMYGLS